MKIVKIGSFRGQNVVISQNWGKFGKQFLYSKIISVRFMDIIFKFGKNRSFLVKIFKFGGQIDVIDQNFGKLVKQFFSLKTSTYYFSKVYGHKFGQKYH